MCSQIIGDHPKPVWITNRNPDSTSLNENILKIYIVLFSNYTLYSIYNYTIRGSYVLKYNQKGRC